MIIECVNCGKKFDVNSDLIPNKGRTIQCGACEHVWFFTKKDQKKLEIDEKLPSQSKDNEIEKKDEEKIASTSKDLSHKKKALVKYQAKKPFTFANFLSYIVVAIISFISLMIILDTFKEPLANYLPNLEIFLYNFFETIKDIRLFIMDLMND